MLRKISITKRLVGLIGLMALLMPAGFAISIHGLQATGDVGIETSKKAMIDGEMARLKLAVDSLASVVSESVQKRSPQEKPDELIQGLLKNARFESDNSGYFFVFRKTVCVAHPANPTLIGTDMGNTKDKNGVPFVAQLYRKAGTEEFVHYVFPKPGAGDTPKISYSQKIKGTDLWIATGVYLDNVAVLEKQMSSTISNISTKYSTIILLSVGFLFICIILPLSLFISKSISKPLSEAVKLAEAVADGNLSFHIETEHNDETGKLQKALKTMTEKLRDIIANIKAGVEDISSSSAQIAVTAKQGMATAREQSATVTEVGVTVEEIDQTSRAVVQQAQEVLAVSKESIEGGKSGIAAVESAKEALALVGQIVDIVDTVNELAEQSNLLAVNAGIEASKAGEQGRGFAVVASEVRNLAQQSKRAGKDIREILARVETGGQAVATTEQAIRKLAAMLDDTSVKARQISGAASQQAAGINQISEAMENVVQGSKDTTAGAEQLESALSSLSALSKQLKETVANYKV